jgi:hypothetical protein
MTKEKYEEESDDEDGPECKVLSDTQRASEKVCERSQILLILVCLIVVSLIFYPA